jgi:allophanate hydrolase
VGINARLGVYTNFANLLDLCAVAIPSGLRANGLPFGVTFIAPAFHEGALASLGAAFHAATGLPLGATSHPVPAAAATVARAEPELRRSARLAVAGLHLSGQPLNGQLLELGARLAATVRTAPCYRMHVIERPGRKFPGLVRVAEGGAVELEVWEMSPAALGAFMEKVAEPLCIGTVELESGEKVKGFLCEAWAAEGTRDITALGGWRTYLAQG